LYSGNYLLTLSRARLRIAAKLSLLVSSRPPRVRPKCIRILLATRPFLPKLCF